MVQSRIRICGRYDTQRPAGEALGLTGLATLSFLLINKVSICDYVVASGTGVEQENDNMHLFGITVLLLAVFVRVQGTIIFKAVVVGDANGSWASNNSGATGLALLPSQATRHVSWCG